MQDYEHKRTAALLALRAFPRSFGMLAGAIFLAINHNPIDAIGLALVVWFVTYLIKSALSPSFVDTYLWQFISTCVLAIGAWAVKWLLYVALVIFAILAGAPLTATLIIMGGLLLYDMFIVFTRGS